MEVTKLLKPLVQKVALGDLASLQAVTRVNAVQASKKLMQELTRRNFGESEINGRGRANQPIGPAGVVAMACKHRGPDATRETPAVIAVWINWQLVRARPGREGWRRGSEYQGSRVMPGEGRGLS